MEKPPTNFEIPPDDKTGFSEPVVSVEMLELEKQIQELSQKNLTDEEKHEIEGKVFDIFNSSDTVLHTTKTNYLYSILQSGLLSHQLAKKFLKRSGSFYGWGYEARDRYGNDDLISLTLNKDGEVKDQIISNDHYPYINLIYSEKEIEDKFKNIKTRSGKRDYQKGLTEGEHLVERKIESKYLRGLAVGKEFLATRIGDLLNSLSEKELSDKKRNFEDYIEIKKKEPEEDRERALTDLSSLKEILNFLSTMGIEPIDVEETGNSSIYKINLLYKGQPVTITKEVGDIKIP